MKIDPPRRFCLFRAGFARNSMGALLTALLIFSCFSVHADPYTQKVTIVEKNISLLKLFKKINKQTGYFFLYQNELLQNSKNVDINVKDSSLHYVLEISFRDQPVTYTILDKTILVKRKPAPSPPPAAAIPLAPPVEVRGKVADENNGPLANVSVTIKGSSTGVTTTGNGEFMIKVPDEHAVLVFSYVGFQSQEVAVRNRTQLNIRMVLSEGTKLNDVVVTALGISKEKKSLSYSVTDVKGSDFTQARENNLGNALSGRIAGVNATSTANGPGGSSRVIIRGNGSLSGDNQPLYVVNGIPINNSVQGTAPGTYGGIDRGDGLISINPDDIESISVLKGGTAAALYGSRAANGVILITTKSGKGQRGLGVEFNSTFTQERVLSIPDWQYEFGSGSRGAAPTSQAEAVAGGRMSWGAKLDGSAVINPDGVARPYSAQKNNIRNFYDNGNTFSNTLALIGGNETANFRFSVSDMKSNGIIHNSEVNRKTFNLSASANISKRIIFEGKAQYNIEENHNRTYVSDFSKNPNASVGLIATNIDVRTLAPGYDEKNYETPWSDYVYVTNPYFAINKVKNEDERRRFIGSASLRFNFTSFLYARGRVGIDYFNFTGTDIEPTGLLFNPQGSMTATRTTTYETNAEALLGFDKKFGLFTIGAIAGGNKMHNKFSGIDNESGLFNVPFQYFLTNGNSPTFTQTYRESAINSLFASADIGFDNLLYLTLTGRKDWFSTLSKKSNSLFYPSVGLSYLFTQSWKSRPSWLNYGKLRASWAQVGGGAPNPYGLSLAYVAPSTSHLGQPLMNISGNTIPNILKPYTSTTAEVGLELRTLNSRLGIDITLYNRTTTDDIVSASVPLSSSYTSVLLNVGKMRNKGIELLLTGTPVSSATGFTWDLSFNMAYNDNKVIKIADGLTSLALPGAEARTNNGFVYHYEDMPFGMISGYRAKTDEKGNIVYNKANGLPIQSEFVALGRGVPPLTLGFTNSFRYKNFNIGFLIDGKFGAQLYTSTNAYGTYYGLDKRTVANNVREIGVAVKGVDEDGNPYSGTIAAQDYFQGIAFSLTDQFVSDAGFIKLRQLTLGYTFPKSIIGDKIFQSVSLSLVARNLFLIYSQAKNVDPESSYNSGNGQGLENFGVPPTRSYGLNLMVRF